MTFWSIDRMTLFGVRLKQARLAAGLSQEQLGIQADLDPMSASTRMNRYELGKRVPAFELVQRLAKVLKLPTSYFYAESEEEAQLLVAFHRMTKARKHEVLDAVIDRER